ncbi:MAG: DNA (cytosine-5-)-methyltransferase [Clostridia bacterium]|nr:DNA (cytosine-5-)-methyltransferase [Clostridia bacterium]
MKLFSLFSGIGGPEKALKRIGIDYELVGYSEIDKYASRSYAAVHEEPEIKNYGDITKINEKELPDFDLMTWGFPCQDISIAGKQAGIHVGTRSGLYFDGLRILKEKKPKYSLIENVKALTSKKFKDTFESILYDLECAGYNNYWQVLDAKDYGIPQHRERVFIVSIRKDVDQEYTFPEKEELKLQLKDLLEDEVDEKYYLSDRMIKTFSDMTNRNGYIRGKCFKPHELDDDRVANTIKTTAGSRPEDNYVKRKYDEFIDEKGYMPEIFNPYNKTEVKDVAKTITRECGSATSSAAHLIAEPRLYEQAYETAENNSCEDGDTIDAFNKKVNKSGISPTVTTRPEGFKTAILIPEATKKGYAEAEAGDGVYINRPHQKRGVVQKDKIQTIKTTPDIGVVVEKKIKYEQPLEREGWHNKAKEVLNPDGISTCIHTQSNNLLQKIKEPSLRIRKLTPLECWRLMGFDDADFYNAQSTGISNTQLYKQAGNSIVVNVLEKIFINLFEKGEK